MSRIFSPEDCKEMKEAADAIGKAAEASFPPRLCLIGGTTLIAQAK